MDQFTNMVPAKKAAEKSLKVEIKNEFNKLMKRQY